MMRTASRTLIPLVAVAGLLGPVGCTSHPEPTHDAEHASHARAGGSASPIAIPDPVAREHEHLHAQLTAATRAGGRTGDAAEKVRHALADHFEQENNLVMPLLGLLGPLAQDRASDAMRPAIAMSQDVERLLPTFMEEHRAIHRAVDDLEAAAQAEGHTDIVGFARRLRLHAQTEEAVLYPAAILVGHQVERALAAQQQGDH